MSKSVLPMFSSKSCIDFGLTFRSLMHFEFILVVLGSVPISFFYVSLQLSSIPSMTSGRGCHFSIGLCFCFWVRIMLFCLFIFSDNARDFIRKGRLSGEQQGKGIQGNCSATWLTVLGFMVIVLLSRMSLVNHSDSFLVFPGGTHLVQPRCGPERGILRGSRTCEYHIALITIAVEYSLMSGKLIPPAPLFFLKIALAIWTLLCFHRNCKFYCSSAVKNVSVNLIVCIESELLWLAQSFSQYLFSQSKN